MRYSIMKTRTIAIYAIAVALLASACSSGGEDSGVTSAAPASVPAATVEPPSTTAQPTTITTSDSADETVSVVVPFTAGNGAGSVEVSGEGSAVAVWLANQPGEVSLDLADADATDDASVVEELVGFWFFSDDASGDVPPSVLVSATGVITDSLGTRYVVEAQGLPAAPGTETPTTTTTTTATVAPADGDQPPAGTSAPSASVPSGAGEETVDVPIVFPGGSGTVRISGAESPVFQWVADMLERDAEYRVGLSPQADISDSESIVKDMIRGFYGGSGGPPGDRPNISVSADGEIIDDQGASYMVETETDTPPEEPATTEPEPEGEVASGVLQVKVLNGSGVAGAAGRMTEKLAEAGYVVLPPGNASRRYATSAVYYAAGRQAEAEEILQTADIDEIEEVTSMPQQFAAENVAVVVLLGTDTAPAVVSEQAGLRPRPRNDVSLPLPASVPRDRFVPGLANIQIFTEATDNDEYLFALAHTLQGWLRFLGNHAHDYVFGVISEERGTREQVEEAYRTIEGILRDFGFTPQNVCGAPAGYSFTDLLQPTREWDENLKTYAGDAILTTDRLIELHGGERINPEENLEFYIREAVQTAHDAFRISELAAETEAMQLILCEAWISPSGEIPEAASSLWYANLTPGIQPQESLMSQGTYHVKEISRNGNFAYVVVCHPTIGARFVLLHWREAGYRAEVVEDIRTSGCQAAFEEFGAEPESIEFSFGERAFSGSDLSNFPRN